MNKNFVNNENDGYDDYVYDKIKDRMAEESYERSVKETHDVLIEHGWKIKAIPDDHRGREIVIYFKGNEEIILERIKSPEDYTANELISELEKEGC